MSNKNKNNNNIKNKYNIIINDVNKINGILNKLTKKKSQGPYVDRNKINNSINKPVQKKIPKENDTEKGIQLVRDMGNNAKKNGTPIKILPTTKQSNQTQAKKTAPEPIIEDELIPELKNPLSDEQQHAMLYFGENVQNFLSKYHHKPFIQQHLWKDSQKINSQQIDDLYSKLKTKAEKEEKNFWPTFLESVTNRTITGWGDLEVDKDKYSVSDVKALQTRTNFVNRYLEENNTPIDSTVQLTYSFKTKDQDGEKLTTPILQIQVKIFALNGIGLNDNSAVGNGTYGITSNGSRNIMFDVNKLAANLANESKMACFNEAYGGPQKQGVKDGLRGTLYAIMENFSKSAILKLIDKVPDKEIEKINTKITKLKEKYPQIRFDPIPTDKGLTYVAVNQRIKAFNDILKPIFDKKKEEQKKAKLGKLIEQLDKKNKENDKNLLKTKFNQLKNNIEKEKEAEEAKKKEEARKQAEEAGRKKKETIQKLQAFMDRFRKAKHNNLINDLKKITPEINQKNKGNLKLQQLNAIFGSKQRRDDEAEKKYAVEKWNNIAQNLKKEEKERKRLEEEGKRKEEALKKIGNTLDQKIKRDGLEALKKDAEEDKAKKQRMDKIKEGLKQKFEEIAQKKKQEEQKKKQLKDELEEIKKGKRVQNIKKQLEDEMKKRQKEEYIAKKKEEGKAKTEARTKKKAEENKYIDLNGFFEPERKDEEKKDELKIIKKKKPTRPSFKLDDEIPTEQPPVAEQEKTNPPLMTTEEDDNEPMFGDLFDLPAEKEVQEKTDDNKIEEPAKEENKEDNTEKNEEEEPEQQAEDNNQEQPVTEGQDNNSEKGATTEEPPVMEKKAKEPAKEEIKTEPPVEEELKQEEQNQPVATNDQIITPPQQTALTKPETSSSTQKVSKLEQASRHVNMGKLPDIKPSNDEKDKTTRELAFKIKEPKQEDIQQQKYETKIVKQPKQLPTFTGERTFLQKVLGFLGTITVIPFVINFIINKDTIGGTFTSNNKNEEIKNWVESQGNEKVIQTFQNWAKQNNDIKNAYKEWFEKDRQEIQENYYQEEKQIVPVREKPTDKNKQTQRNKNTMLVDNSTPKKSKETINKALHKQNIRVY